MNKSIKGLDDLQKQLKKMQQNLKKVEGTHSIEMPYSTEEWKNMTEYEREKAKEKATNEYIDKVRKDILK